MKPITILFVFGLVAFFSFSRPDAISKPFVIDISLKKTDQNDSVPVFKITRANILISRREKLPTTLIGSNDATIKFDAQTNIIKFRGSMNLSFPNYVNPNEDIEMGGDNATWKKQKISWKLNFPEKKIYLFTFNFHLSESHNPSAFYLRINSGQKSQLMNFPYSISDKTYSVILDYTEVSGDAVIEFGSVYNNGKWYFSNLLIQTIN